MAELQTEHPKDELILQHLGTAVMFCWSELPRAVHAKILPQADDIIGLAPMTDVRSEIKELLARRIQK